MILYLLIHVQSINQLCLNYVDHKTVILLMQLSVVVFYHEMHITIRTNINWFTIYSVVHVHLSFQNDAHDMCE